MENKPFKDTALAIQAIHTRMKSTTIVNPLTCGELHRQLVDVTKDEKQCENAIRRMYSKGELLKIREGKNVRYWWNDKYSEPVRKTAPAKAPTPPKVVVAQTTAPTSSGKNIPEILVTQTSVVIMSDRIKITVEI